MAATTSVDWVAWRVCASSGQRKMWRVCHKAPNIIENMMKKEACDPVHYKNYSILEHISSCCLLILSKMSCIIRKHFRLFIGTIDIHTFRLCMISWTVQHWNYRCLIHLKQHVCLATHFILYPLSQTELRTHNRMISSRTGFSVVVVCCLFYAMISFDLYGKLWLSIQSQAGGSILFQQIFKNKNLLSFHWCY